MKKQQLPVEGPRPENPLAFYNELLRDTLEYVHFTIENLNRQTIRRTTTMLKSARRIFFTGSGSSLAAATIGSLFLQARSSYPAAFASTSTLLDAQQLNSNDVVVLVSHGLNRPDALLVVKAAAQKGALLIGITGHPERDSVRSLNATVMVYPRYERLFCRPVSPITSYIAVLGICKALAGEALDIPQIQEQITVGLQEKELTLSKHKRYVILASGLAIAGATQMCLALREGAGIVAQFQEIESYGHGVYVPDLGKATPKEQIEYILLEHKKDPQSQRALKRILPMLDNTRCVYHIFSSTTDAVYGNLYHLALSSKSIGYYLQKSGYDFNNPPGMKENYSFHEITSPWNTYDF